MIYLSLDKRKECRYRLEHWKNIKIKIDSLTKILEDIYKTEDYSYKIEVLRKELNDLKIIDFELSHTYHQLDEDDKKIVDMYFIKGFSADKISLELFMDRSTVFRKINRIYDKFINSMMIY